MTPKYYEYLHSGYVPIMWPYRHVFRAMPRRRALCHAGPSHAMPSRYTRHMDRAHCPIPFTGYDGIDVPAYVHQTY